MCTYCSCSQIHAEDYIMHFLFFTTNSIDLFTLIMLDFRDNSLKVMNSFHDLYKLLRKIHTLYIGGISLNFKRYFRYRQTRHYIVYILPKLLQNINNDLKIIYNYLHYYARFLFHWLQRQLISGQKFNIQLFMSYVLIYISNLHNVELQCRTYQKCFLLVDWKCYW